VSARLLEGRVVVVTGAGGGVGRGIALALGAHGASVVLAVRRSGTGEPVADEIRAGGGEALCVRTDVTVRDDLAACIAATVDRYGRLDAFVHNALGSTTAAGRVEDIDADHWDGMVSTAVRASFDAAQLSFPHLRASGGSLVLVSSAAGVEGSAYLPVYAMVKAAQRGLGKSLAREWGPEGVRVNMLGPVAMTPAMERAYRENPVLEERLVARTPLRRIGDPPLDIGPAVVFLVSDLARYVTGQTLMVDGGGFLGL
jgi:NAD(P)-dependent dehydrogenase (short-subunit alcohol dehydrogenase family)